MAHEFQFPYSKLIKEDGEIIPASDHNKQEHQLEALTDAVGDYNFFAGTIESRLTNIVSDVNDIQNDIINITNDITTIENDIITINVNIATIQNDILSLQSGLTSLENRVTILENKPPPFLNDLLDVDVPSPNSNDVLSFDGIKWISVKPVSSLNDLLDVNILGAQVGDSLVFDASTGTGAVWKPANRQIKIASGLPGSTDENVAFPVTEIRFISLSGIGDEHEVLSVADGIVYIGPGSPPDLLSALDGLNSVVTGKLTFDSSITNPTTYPPGLSAGDTYNKITNSTSFTFNTLANEFGFASVGNLLLKLNGVEIANIDLGANFVESDRDIGQNISNYNTQGSGDPITNGIVSFAGGFLQLNSVAPHNGVSIDEFQKGSALISLDSIALRKGYNIVELVHATTFGSFTATVDFFWDANSAGSTNDPNIVSVGITENTPIFKFISGVKYYDANSTFNLNVVANNLFDNVYIDSESPIVIQGLDGSNNLDWFGPLSSISIFDPSVSGVSNPPQLGESMNVINHILTVDSGQQTTNAKVSAAPVDPYNTYNSVDSPTDFYTIVSVSPTSNDTFENFFDERYRLPNTTNFDAPISGMPGPPLLFDPTIPLTAGSRVSELQVYDHTASSSKNRLVYPHFDYSNSATFKPQSNPNYSSLPAGVRTYYRVFRSTVGDRTNGILTVTGISELDLLSGIGLKIKVPGKTVWLDLSKKYVPNTFLANASLVGGLDGEGCRIDAGEYNLDVNNSIAFTLGSIGTDSFSDWQLIVEITYSNSSVNNILGSGAGLSINW